MTTSAISPFQRSNLRLPLIWLWTVYTILLIKISFSTGLVVDVIGDLNSEKWEDNCTGGYHQLETYTCNSQSVIPAEDYTGSFGYWAQCPEALVLVCKLIYHVSVNEVLKEISIEAYFSGSSGVEIEIRKAEGFLTRRLQGSGWTTVNLDLSDQLDILEVTISPEYHSAQQLAVIDKISIDEPPSTTPTDLPTTTDYTTDPTHSNTGSTDSTTLDPDTSSPTTTTLSTTEFVDSTTETEYLTTDSSDTTGTADMTTNSPDTTETADITTDSSGTTGTADITTDSSATTGSADITTDSSGTTGTADITTDSTTGPTHSNTGSTDSTTLDPDTSSPTTTTLSTTEFVDSTTETDYITTGSSESTGTTDMTTDSPDTTETTDITTDYTTDPTHSNTGSTNSLDPDTSSPKTTTLSTTEDSSSTTGASGTTGSTGITIPGSHIPSTSQTNPMKSSTTIQTTEGITNSYSTSRSTDNTPNPGTTRLPSVARSPKATSYLLPVLLIVIASLVILAAFQCCVTWFRNAEKKRDEDEYSRYGQNTPYKKFVNKPSDTFYSLQRPSPLGPTAGTNTTTIAYNFNRKRELETGYPIGNNNVAQVQPNASYHSPPMSPTSPTGLIEPFYSKANRSGRSSLYGYGMDPAQEYFPRLARRSNNYDNSPV